MVVTDLALAAGAASVPGPVTDIGDDGWFLYVPIVQSGRLTDSQDGTQYPFDSKAKRIVETGSSLVAVVENAHASIAFDINLGFRMLSMVRGTR